MRAFFALFLSLVLALGSVSMAVARGQAPMGQQITLCTATGNSTVELDRNGKPVPATRHLCPDCLSAATAFVLPATLALPSPAGRVRGLEIRYIAATLPSTGRIPAIARGPPSRSV